MREGEWKGRLSEPWMTACDATLVIVREDRGVYAASLALSPLMAVCVCVCVCVCLRRCGMARQGCPCLDSGCSSVDGNTQGGKGGGVCVCVCVCVGVCVGVGVCV